MLRPKLARRPAERFVAGNRVTLLRNGSQAFPAIFRAIESAQLQILIEMYWLSTEGIGASFLHALSRALSRGVEVWLMRDGLGSQGSDDREFEQLRHAGARVAAFHPIRRWRELLHLERLTRRNHGKVVCVDGRRAFVGGLNISDEWLELDEGGGGWRDDVAEVVGPAVHNLAAYMRTNWLALEGEGPELLWAPDALPGGVSVAVIAQAGFRQQRDVIRAYVDRIRAAKHYVYIANAYFVPGPRVLRALRNACGRGLDVRIMVPAVSDVEVVRHASRRVWTQLHAAGARVFAWQQSVLHSKTAVMDGSWATVGSLNLDYLSLWRNLELNVSIQDATFAKVVEASFLEDLKSCREVDEGAVRFRSLGDRVMEAACYRLRAWL